MGAKAGASLSRSEEREPQPQAAVDEREASWGECSPAGKGFWGSDLHITLWGCCDRGPLSHTMGQKPFQGVLLGQRA